MKEVLNIILPKIIREQQYKIIPHEGKKDLQKALRKALPSLCKQHEKYRLIVILHDQDQNRCQDIKGRLLQNLPSENDTVPIKIRIVCRELENWYLGDLEAISQAYPRFDPKKHRHKTNFRDPDDSQGAFDLLKKSIPEVKRKTITKVELAKMISPYMSVDHNLNKSFKQFKDTLQ